MATGLRDGGAPVAPKPQGPLETPHPALQAAGFNGGIQQFNAKVQAIADAHHHAYGSLPSPGLTLDVARSDVQPKDYPTLFSVPRSPIVAQAQGAVAKHQQQNPDDYFFTRPDGVMQVKTPFTDLAVNQHVALHPTTQKLTPSQWMKKYPMVQMGALPIPNAEGVYRALRSLNAPLPQQDTSGMTPEQMLAVGRSPDVQISAAEEASMFGKSPIANTPGAITHDVRTIQQAQKDLNKAMGTDLPVTGVINDDWQKALSNWMKSGDYFRKQLAYQAQNSGFGNNVGAYVKAWQSKQKATSHGLYGHFLQAMPLPLFGHGGFWQDIGSLPFYLKGSSDNPLNVGLHGLTRTAGLALDTVGGTVSQAKADTAAATTLATYMIGLHGQGYTYEEALQKAREQLDANPTWLRAFSGGRLPVHEKGFLANLDEGLLNPLGDLVLMRKPEFTGERVAAGDVAAANNSTYLNTAASWAYQDLKKFGENGIGRAASRLEGGQGSRAFVSRAAELIKAGKLTQEQFASKLAELYSTGHTTLENISGKTNDITGPTLSSLRSAKLPTPGKLGQWWLDQKGGLRDWADEFDKQSRGPNAGLTGRAPDFVLSLRSAIAHAAPKGGRLGYFQDILPERVFNFVVKHKLGDDTVALANKLESDLVRFQGRENIRGIQSVEQQIRQLYHEKYGRAGTKIQDDPFSALLETEAPSVFKFPGGDERTANDAMSSIARFTNKVNNGLNKAAQVHARIILSGVNPLTGFGGFSLFWKHTVGDGLRAIVGGIGDALTPDVRAAKAELQRVAAADPELSRRLGATLDRMRTGEASWALNRGGWNIETKSFRTGDYLGDEAHLNAAGEFLRRQLDSKALAAFQQGGDALRDLVLSDKTFRALWQSFRKESAPRPYEAGTAEPYVSGSGLEDIDSIPGRARGKGYLYHRSGADSFEEIRKSGLLPAKPRGGNPEGVYFGNDPLQARGLSWKYGNSVFFRVARTKVKNLDENRAFGESVTPNGIPPSDLEYLGNDGKWHPATAGMSLPTAEDFASLIEQRYKDIQDSLAAKGLSFDDATAVLNKNLGHDAGPALGDWIKENGVDFPVTAGQVETRGTFDELTGRWVGNVIMRPNKFWRKSLGETILAKHYSLLRQAGFDEKTAVNVATDVAEKTVKYHMLDFANRLQVEQDLRWLSYFATKHRLYFKWVLSTFARNPRYAAAVSDFQQALNQSGGVSLPFTVLGQKWQIPLERLVWVPGREYDETSPAALGVWNFIKSGGNLDAAIKGAAGTNGNILTRSDTATRLGTKLLKIETGKAGATYGEAVAGLDKKTADSVRRAINEYQIEFYKEHGHYAPESQAVKTVLLHQLGQEYWRANLPLPVVPDQNATDQQQLLQQYMALIDPKKRAKFLDQHPGFSDHFGVYDDPKRYLHNREFFQRWTSALDAYHAARRDLYAQAKKQGEWTTELEQKRRELNAALQTTRQKLLIQDAQSSGIDTKGGVPNGTTIPYGPWGKVVNKDPQFDPSHFLSALFPKLGKDQVGDIIGPLQKSLQNELTLLNDPQYVRSAVQTPEEIKTLKREILQKLEVFKSYPSDALGKVRDTYQTKYVNKYWATYDAKLAAIKNAPTAQRSAADSAFRAWRDSQDKPVVVDGIKFPAPLRMAWATLDPKTRQERLDYLASKPASSLADYELDLLGVKHPPNVSEALAAIDKAKQEYQDKYPGHSITKSQIVDVAKQIDKQKGYEGFYSYYVNTLTQPRIVQFKQTNLYQDMPSTLRAKFDQGIGNAATEVAKAIQHYKSTSYYKTQWRKAVQQQIQPWLDAPDNKDLKDYLAPFGPNFLDELPGS